MDTFQNSQLVNQITSFENRSRSNFKPNKFMTKEKGGRPLLIDVTSTAQEIGPGRYEELRSCFPQLGRKESSHSNQETHIFRSKSPRLAPLLVSPAPIPGRYGYQTIIDEILSKKCIGKNGKFFTTSQKFYKHAVDEVPGPGKYENYQTARTSPLIRKFSFTKGFDSEFASKIIRDFVKQNDNKDSPPVGLYNTTSQSIEKNIERRMKHKLDISHKVKKTGGDVAFESRESRFKFHPRPLYTIQLGPGSYSPKGQFDNTILNRKPNLLNSKTDRFNKDLPKYPVPEDYKLFIKQRK